MLKVISQGDKTVIDVVSVLTGLGALMSVLPAIAALLTIVWTGLRIYETDTVQSWLKKGDKDE